MYQLKVVMIMLEFENVINNVTMFHKIFDIIRIVDPVKKDVIFMKKNVDNIEVASDLEKSSCYTFWANEHVCDNCISMRALTENDIFVKFEYAHSRLFMTTAYPLEVPYTGYVVEIIKDVTKSELIGSLDNIPLIDLYTNIESKNRELITDNLTGLYNKRYLTERLPYELVNNNLKGYDSALLMIDLDHFKNINDIFGHLAGDYILRQFSVILKDCIREDYDWAARFGGEEFVVYLKNIKNTDLDIVCEKIRSRVESSIFNYERNIIPVTVSIGASHISSGVVISYDEILKITDRLLYSAKNKGRNTFISKEVRLIEPTKK